MKEFRRSRRRQATDTIHITDAMTESVIGHLGNVSETGMLVMASAPLVNDALYQLRFTLSNGQQQRMPLEVGAHLLWQDNANSAGQTWTGFRFITVPQEQMLELRNWIDAPGGQFE